MDSSILEKRIAQTTKSPKKEAENAMMKMIVNVLCNEGRVVIGNETTEWKLAFGGVTEKR